MDVLVIILNPFITTFTHVNLHTMRQETLGWLCSDASEDQYMVKAGKKLTVYWNKRKTHIRAKESQVSHDLTSYSIITHTITSSSDIRSRQITQDRIISYTYIPTCVVHMTIPHHVMISIQWKRYASFLVVVSTNDLEEFSFAFVSMSCSPASVTLIPLHDNKTALSPYRWCIHITMHVYIYVCMHACNHVCMYVCIYVIVYVCMSVTMCRNGVISSSGLQRDHI